MRALAARAELLVKAGQKRALGSIARKLLEEFPAGQVAEDEGSVAVQGRGIVRRFLTEPSLRFLQRGQS